MKLSERVIADLLGMAVPDALGAELLARSSSAAVYRVVDASMSSVVVKIVDEAVARRVAGLHAELGRTPGLLGLRTAGASNGFGYLLFPYLAESLADRVERGRLAPVVAAELLDDVAGGLERLHRLGYVHGDVKPGNVLITAEGRAALGDLDGAAPVGAEPVRVTPGFCPPEQLAGQRTAVSFDTYAFAALVATALTGGTGWMAAPPTRLAPNALPDVPPAALEAVLADLSPDPARRTARPTALLAALSAARARSPALPVERATMPSPDPTSAVAVAAQDRPAVQPPPSGDELAIAAQRVWGFVDLRAVTADRLPLQLIAQDGADVPESGERSIWRRPAMIASLIAAVLLVAAGIVLTILG